MEEANRDRNAKALEIKCSLTSHLDGVRDMFFHHNDIYLRHYC